MLLLEQGPYLLYVNLDYKDLGYKIYTAIIKNHMQKTLDAIISENQSVGMKNRTMLHVFFTIQDVIEVSYELNLALISLNFRELFTE